MTTILIGAAVLLAVGFSHALFVSRLNAAKAEITAEIAKLKSKVR